MGKPIFLDRDGVINEDISPYVTSLDQLKVFPWTGAALGRLCAAGYDIYVVSNQQGVALGITPPELLEEANKHILEAIAPHGATIKKFYYCTAHDGENHPWRKPSCGMLLAAAAEFDFNPAGAFMIGDKDTDLIAGVGAGCRPLLVLSGVTAEEEVALLEVQPEAVFPNLSEAVDFVLSQG